MDETPARRRRASAWRWALRLGAAGLGLMLVGALALVLWLAPDFPDRERVWTAGTLPSQTYLDYRGERIAMRGAIRAESIPVTELPQHLVRAFLATEDRRFYRHGGLDARGIARALLVNLRAGRFVEGGSTITQQVAKNLFLSPERSARRKIQEAILAVWLERRLSKDEILTLYLNRIYFGAGTYGIEAAAQTYFGRSAREVSLAEAAMLAGLPKAPSRLAPTADLSRAQARAASVLQNMVEAGYLTGDEITEALAEPAEPQPVGENFAVQYFLDHVALELQALLAPADLERDLIITTTLHRELQDKAGAAVEARLAADGEAAEAGEAALVALARDGAIRALVGGRSYEASQFNRATQARRQPGSAFKPFVYAAALEAGLSPQTMREDAPITVDRWTPENYGRTHVGPVSLREAVEQSINTVAVRVSEEVGRESVTAMAERLGIGGDLPELPSIALGAAEVSLLELTGAYIPFATGGLKAEPYSIVRIATPEGGTLYERPAREPERVLEPEIARDMTFMLHQVMLNGTGRAAHLGARPAAGKTGTSQEWRDAWFVGYTGDLITGVWVGNDDETPMARVTGGGLPARIWHDYMAAAHEGWAVAELDGAVPAASPVQSDAYAAYLDRLSRQFTEVRHMRSAAARPARGNGRSRRSIWPWNW